jgi:hypothetical protein
MYPTIDMAFYIGTAYAVRTRASPGHESDMVRGSGPTRIATKRQIGYTGRYQHTKD